MTKKFISIFTIICMLAVYMPSLVFANDGTIPDEQVTEEVTEPEEEVVEEVTEPEEEEEPVVEEEKAEPEEVIELSGGQKSDNNIVLNSRMLKSSPNPTTYNVTFICVDTENVKYSFKWELKSDTFDVNDFNNMLKGEGFKLTEQEERYFVSCMIWDGRECDNGGVPYEIEKLESSNYEVTYHYIVMNDDGTEKEVGSGTVEDVHYGTGLTEKMMKTIKNNVPKNYRWDTGTDNLEGGAAAEGETDVNAYVNPTTRERLYAKVLVYVDENDKNPKDMGTTCIYVGEAGNGASLSTKYADKDVADRTGLYTRLNNKYAETDVEAELKDGVVTFRWIHHIPGNSPDFPESMTHIYDSKGREIDPDGSKGYYPERVSRDFPLVVDGVKIKASDFGDGIKVDSQESSSDQYDVHTFTIKIYLSKLTDVIVHYVDEEGNEIAKSETLTNYEDEKFNKDDIEIKDIEGYENPEVGETPEKYPSEGSVDVYVEYEKVPEYVVTYTDGVDGEEVFKDQVYPKLKRGVDTPAFEGTPEREGYIFSGWAPEVSKTVTGDATYVAQWRPDKVNYAVEYYYQKNGEYVEPDSVEVRKGTTGTEATLTADDAKPKYDGYVLDEDNENTIKAAEIKADGSTVLRIYFEEQFNVIIHYVNKETGYEIEEARYENTKKWGEEIDVLSPVPPTGYKFEDSADERIQKTIKDDFERWVYYVPIEYNVVIHYVDEDGNPLAEDYTDTVKYGKSFEKTSPEVEGYELVNENDVTVGREDVRDNFEYSVVYKLKEYPATITYVDEDGNELTDPYKEVIKHGDNLEVTSPEIEGYELVNEDDVTVSAENVTEPFTYEVKYTKKEYPVIIHYVDENGKVIAEDVTLNVKYKDAFTIESPTLEGYELVNEGDSVVARENVTEPFEYTVVYKMITPEDPEDPTTPEDPTDSEDVTDNVVIHSTSPQTGDGFELVLWSGAALLAVLLIYYLVAKRKY